MWEEERDEECGHLRVRACTSGAAGGVGDPTSGGGVSDTIDGIAMGPDGFRLPLGDHKLNLPNDILLDEAMSPLHRMEHVRACGVHSPTWRQRANHDKKSPLEIFETADHEMHKHAAVVAKTVLSCTLQELFQVWMTDDQATYESVMKALYGQRFRRGAILHSADEESAHNRLAVKTAAFGSSRTNRVAELCFVDYRSHSPETKSITHVLKSMPREFHDRIVSQSLLEGVSDIATSTHAEPVGPGQIRVFFYGYCSLEGEDKRSPTGKDIEKVKQLLLDMANTVDRVMDVVQRRRLGHQVFLYGSYVPSAVVRGLKHCKVCRKTFNIMRGEHMCHLCGYRVCNHCSESVEVEPEPGTVRTHRVCCRCCSIVNGCCVFESSMLGSPPVTEGRRTGSYHELLETLNRTSLVPMDDLPAAIVEDVFSSNPFKQSAALTKLHVLPAATPPLEILERELCDHVGWIARLSVEECDVAERDGRRSYALDFEDGLDIPHAPLVTSDLARINAVDYYGLLDPEFAHKPYSIICELAAKIIDCRVALLSVVTQDVQHAVAHYGGPQHKLPRRETVCAYALTSLQPFIVRDAWLDLRFREFFCVARSGFRFYASFPVILAGVSVASLVVMDKAPRATVTTQQFSRLRCMADVVKSLLLSLPRSSREP